MASPESVPLYGEDLAYVHDAGFGQFARGAAPGILQLLRRADQPQGLVIDVGCGSGIWAKELLDAGFQVIGLDISPAMIALARQRVPTVTFHQGSLCDFELPRCRAITALGEVLCYAAGASSGRDVLGDFFRRAYAALEPSGMLVFDVAEVGLDRQRPPAWFEGNDWACGVSFRYDDVHDQLLRTVATFRRTSGTLYRRGTETHRLQLFRRGDVARLLRQSGFRVRKTRRYGAWWLLPKRVAFLARKAPSSRRARS